MGAKGFIFNCNNFVSTVDCQVYLFTDATYFQNYLLDLLVHFLTKILSSLNGYLDLGPNLIDAVCLTTSIKNHLKEEDQ